MNVGSKLLLCVEDDEDDCTWIKEAALEIDPKLRFVNKSNGREAMQFLNYLLAVGNLPCLILLDINMPVMGGKETLAAIKSDPKLKELPVVVFSTSSNPRDRLFCEHYGAEFVTKPSQLMAYKKIIQKVVQQRCA
jgi:CheY-like chemotaxis protein